MAETIVGGAYLAADKKTWIDSQGKPLDAAQVKAAEAALAKHADELALAETKLQEQVANSRNVIVVREAAPVAAPAKAK